jgi:hypothetical protein
MNPSLILDHPYLTLGVIFIAWVVAEFIDAPSMPEWFEG